MMMSRDPRSGVQRGYTVVGYSMVGKRRLTLLLVALLAVTTNAHALADSSDGSLDLTGAYELMDIPTPAELTRLQNFALRNGVDLDATLQLLPENDVQAWTRVFALSMTFRELDRQALVYGYRLSSAFKYYVDVSGGVAGFGRLLEIQQPGVRQRVRDFLYYDARMARSEARSNQEARLRKVMRAIFPPTYQFGKDDVLFGPSRPLKK
jgi:hypothetical protein